MLGVNMEQSYYDKLAERLWDIVETKYLSADLESKFNQYADMLHEDVLDSFEKYKISIYVEKLLSDVRDFPDKKKSTNGIGK